MLLHPEKRPSWNRLFQTPQVWTSAGDLVRAESKRSKNATPMSANESAAGNQEGKRDGPASSASAERQFAGSQLLGLATGKALDFGAMY
jgi:hypothetical protein